MYNNMFKYVLLLFCVMLLSCNINKKGGDNTYIVVTYTDNSVDTLDQGRSYDFEYKLEAVGSKICLKRKFDIIACDVKKYEFYSNK